MASISSPAVDTSVDMDADVVDDHAAPGSPGVAASSPNAPTTEQDKTRAKRKQTKSQCDPTKVANGTSFFPASRIARIIKADRDVDVCSREAVFCISSATEYFVKHLMDMAYLNARIDKRKVVTYKDINKATADNPELNFLKGTVPAPIPYARAMEHRQAREEASYFFDPESDGDPTAQGGLSHGDSHDGPLPGNSIDENTASVNTSVTIEGEIQDDSAEESRNIDFDDFKRDVGSPLQHSFT